MDDFLVRALLAGLGLAAVAGPFGSFVVWRRMAYFGDTLAHAALLGITAGFLAGVDPTIGIVAVCIAVALLLVALRQRRQLADDTLLGILSHGSLALGLVVLGLAGTVRVDLMGYLFGDILAVSVADLGWIYGGGALALAALLAAWRWLLFATVHEDLARVQGVPVLGVQILFMVLMALVVALAMKVVGILLVTALLIIPAATARALARTPEQMAALGAAIGAVAVLGGLQGSLWWDLPAGPAIVAAALAIFVALLLLAPLRARWSRSAGRI